MSAEDPELASARFSWDEGLARIALPAAPAVVKSRRRIISAVHDELRRRLGMTFTLIDLARVYDAAPGWYLDLAARTAPREPDSWDPAVTLDAAFATYSRGATDARR